MINESEIQISNKSYINKDFASIYPEILDLAKKMSRRWDPETSNESDPGIVLLKLLGFVGDKLNYNVDKNVLECFMPSCTQESSMRALCDMMGYEMGYYEAPEAEVTFSYSGSSADDQSPVPVILPALETSVSDSDETVFYVLTQPVMLSMFSDDAEPQAGKAIQGTVSTLNVGDSEVVGLANLDDANRIYFPVSGVAQNGVFIENVDASSNESASGFWTRSLNLNVEPARALVYKFGFDSSRGLPYVEFPDDIASIIGDGIRIRYVVTSGVSGAVSANMLTRLASPTEVDGVSFVTDPADATDGNPVNLVVSNPSASTAGSDPETIDEAYNSFKRTVGTFDTLVTCRDYANAIYGMRNPADGSDYVSNVQVSDRRDDLNRSWRTVTLTETGQAVVNANVENPGLASSSLDANTLCLYLFRPMTSATEAGFADSFRSQGTVPDREIVDALEDSKTASHDYAGYGLKADIARSNDIAAIKNYMRLQARLTTTYKVNDAERADIVANVKKALIRDYNMRKVDWGYEIPFDSLLKTITEADKRISSVSLAEPELSTKAAYVDPGNAERDFLSFDPNAGDNPYVVVAAKNILAGRIPLFEYDSSFEFDFGQRATSGAVSDNLRGIGTAWANQSDGTCLFPVDENEKTYNLRANEVLQFVRPSLVDVMVYSAYVYYIYDGADASDGTDYVLKTGETLRTRYTDSDDVVHEREYKAGDIIRPSGFDLSRTPNESGDGRVEVNGEWWASLTASQSITERKLNRTVLEKTPYYCYWIVSNADNELFTDANEVDGGYERILGDNEYFFYTDASFRSMVSLGSGTTIRTDVTGVSWKAPALDLEEALGGGLLSMKDKWVYFNFKTGSMSGKSIEAEENEILTLVEGDSFTPSSTLSVSPNDFTPVDLDGASYVSGGEEGKFPGVDLGEGYGWKARTRLDLDFGPSTPQTLLDGHYVCAFPMSKDSSGNWSEGTPKVYSPEGTVPSPLLGKWADVAGASPSAVSSGKLMSSVQMQASGQWGIDLKSPIASMSDVPDDEEKTRYYSKFDYPVSVYGYSIEGDYAVGSIDRDSRGFGVLEFPTDGSLSRSFDYPDLGEESIFAVYWIPSEGSSIELTATGGTIGLFNVGGESAETGNIALRPGLNNVHVSAGTSSVAFSVSASSGSASGRAVVTEPRMYTGWASELGLAAFGDSEGDVMDAVLELLRRASEADSGSGEGRSVFMYPNAISNADALDVDDITSPYSFYEYNNAANKFTISEIDFEGSDIDVARSSRL